MSGWKTIDDTPPIGRKFVVLYNDGSGASMFWRHDCGYIDSEGEEYEELPSESYSLWTELPDGFDFWCEVRSEDPMTLALPPRSPHDDDCPSGDFGPCDCGAHTPQVCSPAGAETPTIPHVRMPND